MFSVVSGKDKMYGVCESIEEAEILMDEVNEMADGKLNNLRIENGVWLGRHESV